MTRDHATETERGESDSNLHIGSGPSFNISKHGGHWHSGIAKDSEATGPIENRSAGYRAPVHRAIEVWQPYFLATLQVKGLAMDVNSGEARDRLSQLVQAVENGEQVTICKNGQPVVDLIRSRPRGVPKFGTMKGRIIVKDPDWHKGPQTNAEVQAWLKGDFE